MTATLILSNYDPDSIDTVIYSNDFGSWNVARKLVRLRGRKAQALAAGCQASLPQQSRRHG